MKNKSLLLVGVVILSTQVSCTTSKPKATELAQLHNSAKRISPYYEVRKKRVSLPTALYTGGLLGLSIFLLTTPPPTQAGKISTQKDVSSRRISGGMVGTVGLGLTIGIAASKRNVSIRTEAVRETGFDEWLRKYNSQTGQHYVKYSQNTATGYLIVPRNQITSYERTERELQERAERERREAAERAEIAAYQNVLKGVMDAHTIYLSTYPSGEHIDEVRAMWAECQAYYEAMRGTIKDCELFQRDWPNARPVFRNAVAARKGNLEEVKRLEENRAIVKRDQDERRLRESRSWVRGDNICMVADGTSTTTIWIFTNEEKAQYKFRAFVEDLNEDHSRFKIRIADMFRNGDTEINKFNFPGTTVWRTNDVIWIDPREWDFSRCH
ncbi:hypothetical protein [Spirosoma sp.]|uniref:hypothetical protein n=1 Tax=Spirosoma sp. TaxID=1899569 RepID=UPI00260BEC42|nr:hypothetical protein [Spirosoma sp.]MCX6212828.1 hypothetical protein [Spirosoma sp.]